MRLKRIELFGFKSFADRTSIEFERSLTGVVGPNGCGKSNVVDAIRWVLGETRPTSMRGSEMADVIFKGSASRAGMSIAEVTMVLDNASVALEDRGPEVSIARRVTKDGEGEYLIDGERVRLKDVREMLFDTGLGSRGYAVLEQGRIDAVLSADPLARRSIFEEAAGISRYRQRRHEVELKLKRVGADLSRVDDVVGELQSRVRSLKTQAGRAERYLDARAEWEELGERLARHRIHQLDAALAEIAGRLAELEERAAARRAERDGVEEATGARERELTEREAELDRVGGEVARLGGDLRALDERRSQLFARSRADRASSEQEDERATALEARLAERRAERDALAAERDRLAELVRFAGETAAAEGVRSREAQVAFREARSSAEAQGERVLGLLHEKTAAENAVQHHESSLEPLEARARRASERLAEARRELEEAREAEAAVRRELEEAERGFRAAEGELEEVSRKGDELESRSAELRLRKSERDLERARLQSRAESLVDRERERENLDAGARALLEEVESGRGPCRAEELRGLLADQLATSTRLARALDAALADAAQALVVSDAEAALRAASWLRRERKGQVHLAFAEAPGEGEAPRESPVDGGPAAVEGVEGPLLAEVRPTRGCEDLARRLLADVWIARDLAAARALSGRFPALRAVTPEGELVDRAGLVGGWRDVVHGPFGRRSAARDLERRASEVADELLRLSGAIERLDDQRARQRERANETAARLETWRERLSAARGDRAREAARVEELARTLALCEREDRGVQAERASCEAQLVRARETRDEAIETFGRENARLEELERERRRLEQERDDAARREGAARVELAGATEQLQGVGRRLADLERVCEESAGEIERARGLAGERRAAAEAAEGEVSELAGEIERLANDRFALEERLAGLREAVRAARETIEEHRRRADEATRELEALSGSISDARLDAQRRELARDDVLRRAEEDFSLSGEEARAGFEPDPELAEPAAIDRLAERVGALRRDLDRLGPVNVDAVKELEEVGGRLEFLEGQKRDLALSRQTLERTLERIDEESERLFLEAFEEIRGNFLEIFRQLFGGGRADVRLDEDAAPLEAGVEIIARPPGREMLPIGLLSGGQRTMTALALLFAVFQARPSPFCILDEVDAALDDPNIARFLMLLDRFRQETQFVVVTHNKGTMTACDVLHGITMEVKGVSRCVSVELSEVDDFVPEIQGGGPPENGSGSSGNGSNGTGGGRSEGAGRRGSDSEPIVELIRERAR